MNALSSRRRRRSSEVLPMTSLHPEPPNPSSSSSITAAARRHLSKIHSVALVPEADTYPATIDEEGEDHAAADAGADVPEESETERRRASPSRSQQQQQNQNQDDSPKKKNARLTLFARSVISQQRTGGGNQQTPVASGREDADEVRAASAAAAAQTHDPWSSVLKRMTKNVGASSQHMSSSASRSTPPPNEPHSARISLAHMLKSHGVKNLVKQATTAAASGPPEARSAVMDHWVKTAMLRNQSEFVAEEEEEDDEDNDEALGIESGFDVRASKSRQMYGRTLLLEESCRRAFLQSGEDRSQTDLQALKAWFQMTKLKITTDFERLQPAELDLLCRRMALVAFHPKEVVFRQGDEGDALFLVFSGVVEVRVGQRILGEKVEVTVCELSKGDYFGERSLISNEARAATVIAKSTVELVRISSKDYNIMLKKDQMEFLSRMQMANGMVIAKSAQQSQREYIRVLAKKKSARTRGDIDMLSEYLQTLKFFRTLPKSFVRELCSVVDFLKLPPGATVFREGEVGDLFYIIFTGSVDVIVTSKDFRGNAQQTKLINLTEGSHFGELALMKGHGIRSATVVTREECKLLVICEKDYNATLRRMQKADLAKRVGVLDQIPTFQTPEWTGELLKEMSYVLSEHKLPAGSVLFKQSDKALQVYFVVRGELVATKDIVDPATQEPTTVLVERIGRFRVVGDDAAAGATFNEVIFREVTVTASTPVEVLILSKYDVFHRLSRAAREALRTAAHSHAESVIYLDRLHKTDKWSAYKQRVLHEHVNHERLAKILAPRRADGELRSQKTTPRTKSSRLAELPSPSATPRDPQGISDPALWTDMLVNANEFLLLPPVTNGVPAASSTRTIGHFVSTFNADAPPSTARKQQLAEVLVAEHRRQVDTLNEGNPLAYFDLEAIRQQEKRHSAEARGRAASTRRTQLISAAGLPGATPSPAAPESLPLVPLDASPSASLAPMELPARTALANTVATNVMNQLAHENFVFSRPARLEDESDDGNSTAGRGASPSHRSQRKSSGAVSTSSSRKASTALKAEVCDGDFVVVSVRTPQVEVEHSDHTLLRTLQSPIVCILAAVSSLSQARDFVRREQLRDALKLAKCDRGSCSGDTGELGAAAAVDAAMTYYMLPKRKYAVLPSANRPRDTEEQLQKELWERFARVPTAPSSSSASGTQSPRGRRPSVATAAGFSERGVSTAPATLATTAPAAPALEPSRHFASFQKIILTMSELREITSAQQQAAAAHERAKLIGTSEKPGDSDAPTPDAPACRLFAVVSVVLSKQEIANSVCEEPFLCVHQLFASEAMAMDAALHVPAPHFRNALLCVVPVGEGVHLEDAYEWCVQVESDRREKRSSSAHAAAHSPSRSKAHPPQSPRPVRTSIKAGGAVSRGTSATARASAAGGSSSPPRASDWETEREKAHRLHQFICSRLSSKTTAAGKERRGQQEASGFTPKPLLTLEDKLATLHEYLASSNVTAATAGARGAGASGLGKYRHVKKFGSIMRARIGSTLATSGLSPSLLNAAPTASVAPAATPS